MRFESTKDLTVKHDWFAWFPVLIVAVQPEGTRKFTFAWLETVERVYKITMSSNFFVYSLKE